MVDLLPPAAGGSVQLERPEKVRSVLEVGTNVEDLVNQILDTDDSELAELVLDDVIGCNGSAITVHLTKQTLVFRPSLGNEKYYEITQIIICF